MLDWNDLRYFLGVADHGSTLAAGRALRVSQTTVARRIAALEAALGFPLFEKRQAGYSLTPAGEELLDRARQMDVAATAFVDRPSKLCFFRTRVVASRIVSTVALLRCWRGRLRGVVRTWLRMAATSGNASRQCERSLAF